MTQTFNPEKNRMQFAAVLGCLWSFAAVIQAEELDFLSLSLSELMSMKVTTVSRVSEGRDRAAGVVYVISADTIKKRGYRSLKDLLRVVPGFTVFFNELMYTAGVRGLNSNDNEKITLLINGYEANGVNEPNFLNGPINLDSVDRIEVIVGPSSLFQQANTLAATVNVITKKPVNAEFVLAVGSEQNLGASVLLGKKWDEDNYISALLSYEEKEGFDAWDENNKAVLAGRDITGKTEPGYFVTLEGKASAWWAQVVAHKSRIPELQLSGAGPNNTPFLTDQMLQLDMAHTYAWSAGLTSKIRLGIASKQQQRENEGGFPPDGGLEQTISQRDYKAEYGMEYSGFKKHFIQAGLQYTYEDNYNSFYTVDNSKTSLYDKNTYGLGAYFSDTWQHTENIKLIFGLRLDKNTLIDDSPYIGGRFSAIYDVSERWITKALVNRAVRMPSPLAALNERWGINNDNPPAFAMTSPTAQDPEVLSTYEWQNIFYLGSSRLSGNLYYQELSDFITWVAPHTNAGDYSGYGFEMDYNHDLNDDLSFWLTGTYIDSEFEAFFDLDSDETIIGNEHVQVNGEGEIVGAPNLSFNVGLNYQPGRSVNINGQIRYFTEQTAFSLVEEDFVKLNDRSYVDLAVMWKKVFSASVDLRLSAQNIFDNTDHVATQWSKNQYRPQGRNVLLTAYINF